MKKINNLLLLSVALFSITLSSCGKPKVDNDTEDVTNLKIMILNKGYGTTWLNKIADNFKSKNPDVNVSIEVASTKDNITTSLKGGKKNNDYDLYFDVSDNQIGSLLNTFSSIDGGFYKLDDLFNMTIPNESITYGDKMFASMKNELLMSDNHYYATPWATSTLGLYYNKTVLDTVLGNDYNIPVTSDELVSFGKDFVFKSGENNTYLLFAKNSDLIARTLFITWWAQYEGIENYNNFTNATYYDDATGRTYKNDVRIYTQTGRLEALKAIEPLTRADKNNGYTLGYSGASTVNWATDFKKIQNDFYNANKKFALMPSGDWLENESGVDSKSTVMMMKTPVVSSIINILEDKTIKDDATLAKVVRAIDNGETSFAGVSDKDFARVKTARNTTMSMANFHIAYIPAYANASKLAISFLLNMATDECIDIYKQNVKGGFLPFKHTYSSSISLTETEKSISKINENSEFVFYSLKNEIFYKGTALYYNLETAQGYPMEHALNVKSTDRGYSTAQTFFDNFNTYYANGAWQDKVIAKL